MRCIQCRGLMVLDQREDLFEINGSLSIEIWRCICCGAREHRFHLGTDSVGDARNGTPYDGRANDLSRPTNKQELQY
ncbi:MAG: hypothetical protein AB7F94_06985 [Nitrospira sp.]